LPRINVAKPILTIDLSALILPLDRFNLADAFAVAVFREIG
jgi:hypothetical protein